eukprot:1414746-Amphidinium_carterae.1
MCHNGLAVTNARRASLVWRVDGKPTADIDALLRIVVTKKDQAGSAQSGSFKLHVCCNLLHMLARPEMATHALRLPGVLPCVQELLHYAKKSGGIQFYYTFKSLNYTTP